MRVQEEEVGVRGWRRKREGCEAGGRRGKGVRLEEEGRCEAGGGRGKGPHYIGNVQESCSPLTSAVLLPR